MKKMIAYFAVITVFIALFIGFFYLFGHADKFFDTTNYVITSYSCDGSKIASWETKHISKMLYNYCIFSVNNKRIIISGNYLVEEK